MRIRMQLSVFASPAVDSACDLVLQERERVLQEPLRLVDAGCVQREAQGEAAVRRASDSECANRISSVASAVRRSADAARRSRWFGPVRHAMDTASTSPSTVPNVG